MVLITAAGRSAAGASVAGIIQAGTRRDVEAATGFGVEDEGDDAGAGDAEVGVGAVVALSGLALLDVDAGTPEAVVEVLLEAAAALLLAATAASRPATKSAALSADPSDLYCMCGPRPPPFGSQIPSPGLQMSMILLRWSSLIDRSRFMPATCQFFGFPINTIAATRFSRSVGSGLLKVSPVPFVPNSTSTTAAPCENPPSTNCVFGQFLATSWTW
ncbi:Uncharacterised protein [Mycobacteroides abscessus subsp. abscessus]|nr:Uncharacterised protein [Mycobacteroides abscessus subsp. abscessus]